MKHRKCMGKAWAFLLVIVMAFAMIPVTAFAEENENCTIDIKTGDFAIEIKDGAGQSIDAVNEGTQDGYAVSRITVPVGTYFYTAKSKDASSVLGSGQFTVNQKSQQITLRQVIFPIETSIPFSMTVQDEQGHGFAASGTSFVLPAIGGDGYYTYRFVPTDTEKYWGSNGKMWVYPSTKADTFKGLNLSDGGSFVIAEKKIITVKVPTGADIKLYHRVKFYRPLEPIEGKKTKSDVDGFDSYDFVVPNNTMLHYEVRQAGKITRAKTFQTKDYLTQPLVIDPLVSNTDAYKKDASQGHYEANLFLNVPDSKYIELKNGEYFDITAFRGWQAINYGTLNYYVDPDFHFSVLNGDSVTINQEGRIQAKKPGVSVVKITYDALQYEAADAYLRDANGLMLYSALWEENTGIIVVDVDADHSTKIDTGIKQREYDTVYYLRTQNGEPKDSYAEYTFTPSADSEIQVRCQKPFQSDWEKGWEPATHNGNGSFTVKLYDGRNIVEVKAGNSVQYHVINAYGLDVTVENKTNHDKPITADDAVTISFNGLSMPVPKLAAIYNPGYPEETWIAYNHGGANIESKHTQYEIRTKNTITVYPNSAGKYVLENGKIHTTSIGESKDMHRFITKASKDSNYNGGDSDTTVNDYFSTLPDIEFDVIDSEVAAEQAKLEFAKLDLLKFGWNLNNINCLKYDSNPPQSFVVAEYKTFPLSINAQPLKKDNVDLTIYENGSGVKKLSTVGTVPKNIELVVTPKNTADGYPKTYAFAIVPETIPGMNAYRAWDLKITLKDGTVNKATDGLLRVKDEASFKKYGWGFLSTQKDYIVTVPYDTTTIGVQNILENIGGILKSPTAVVRVDLTEAVTVGGISAQPNTTTWVTLTGKETPIQISRACTYTGINISQKTVKGTASEEQDYTITVLREAAPQSITFEVPEGATILVKDSTNKTMPANKDGTYFLKVGKYTSYISKSGYMTKIVPFEVTEDASTHTVQVKDLEAVKPQSGNVCVKSEALDRVVRGATTITIDEPADFAKQEYVEYNVGGYTALHAIIDAFNTGIAKVPFSCKKGVLIPNISINTTGQGSNAGWVCEVNGKACDPATTLVNNGDRIDFYYNPDYPGMKHAWFDKSAVTVTAGNSADVTLVAASVNNDGSTASGVEGATIKVNGTVAGVTKSGGGFNIPTEMIKDPGEYTITAEKIESGKNILTYAYAIVSVKKAGVEVTPGKTDVTFRLIGDAKHNGIGGHGKYVTWIATKKYSFEKDSVSVYEVFTQALKEAGLDYVGAERNYVSKIKAPKAYGGYWLAEFTNGQNSGWMYTVNGIHPKLGLKDCYVTTGDVIIWHYVDDYTLETSFEGSVPSYPNRWLEAEDEDPPTNGKIIDMSNGNQELVKEAGTASATVGVEAKVDAKGKATAFVEKKDITTAIQKVIQGLESVNGETPLKKIVIAISGTEKANAVEINIPKASVAELDKDIDIVTVRTAVGEVSFDKKAFDTLAKDASGDLKLTITKVNAEQLVNEMKTVSETDKEIINNRPVFEFKAEVGSKTVSDFDGKVTVTIPYEKKDKEQVEGLLAYWLQDNGKLSPVLTSKANNDGKYIEMTTTHWSKYVIGYRDIHFADTEKHWADSNIRYLAARDVIKGKEDNCFVPNNQITRAEFVQILANLSGADLSSFKKEGATAFTDVAANAWYAEAAEWAKNQGIAEGSNGLFNPNANISREDMAVMITRYVSKVNKETLNSSGSNVTFIDDAKISSYAKEAVMAMQKAGIINGVQNNLGSYTFNPKANATRAEAATMMANYMKH